MPEHLARAASVKVMSLTMPGCEMARDLEDRRTGDRRRARGGKSWSMLRPTISEIMRSMVISAVGARADHVPVAQHDDVVAQAQHVAEDVADIDDRDALRAQPVDDVEEAVGLARRQRCRRLVEDDDLRLGAQRLGDLDELALALRQPADQRRRRQVEVDRGEQFAARWSRAARRSMNGRPTDQLAGSRR